MASESDLIDEHRQIHSRWASGVRGFLVSYRGKMRDDAAAEVLAMLEACTQRAIEPEAGVVTGPQFVARALDDASLAFIEMRTSAGEAQISPAEYVHAIMVQRDVCGNSEPPVAALRILPVEITCSATVRDVMEAVTPLVGMHFPEGEGQGVKFSIHYEEHSAAASNEITHRLVVNDVAALIPEEYKDRRNHAGGLGAARSHAFGGRGSRQSGNERVPRLGALPALQSGAGRAGARDFIGASLKLIGARQHGCGESRPLTRSILGVTSGRRD